MHKEILISVSPEVAYFEELYKREFANLINIDPQEITGLEIKKKSIDARHRKVNINLHAEVWWNEPFVKKEFCLEIKDIKNGPEVLIIGSGPAGLFAALKLIEKGIKPVIFERGKEVKDRKNDIQGLNTNKGVNSESNYCFGEGGAGTFSDGKLYTRSKKKGDVTRIMDILKLHGANENILSDAHPHIGTNKLPGIIINIRETIIDAGGLIQYAN
jgi:uncharacterized FAD-dependent dehydrogenase